MIITVAAIGLALLAGLAVLQALLIAGRPLGRFAWGGQHQVLPPKLRIGSAVSIVLYALFALVILDTAVRALDTTGDNITDVAIWVLTAYFVVGVGMNAISRSRPERMLMTPVALVLAVVCLVLALA